MNKLTRKYQEKFSSEHLYEPGIKDKLKSFGIALHNEIDNPLSSQAACLNVLGYLAKSENKKLLMKFLNNLNIHVDDIFEFPSGVDLNGEKYLDEGLIIFEWMGPKKSVINETGGNRGAWRTSVDAFIIAIIAGKITQIFIEWKFTESYLGIENIAKFAKGKGVERLKRYSQLLAKYRKNHEMPFRFGKGIVWGLADLGYEPFYQLLRMLLLARETLNLEIGKHTIDDYKIVHLSHSSNEKLNVLHPENLVYCPGLRSHICENIHDTWRSLLTEDEQNRFIGGYWDKALIGLPKSNWLDYCKKRYCLE